MTTEAFAPAPLYVVATIGPYEVPHAYSRRADLIVEVQDGEALPVVLSDLDWSVTPEASSDGGDLSISAAALALHAGKRLIITRATAAEQGWIGQTARESGLEAQLDRDTRAIQDLQALADRTPRLPRDAVADSLVLPVPTPGAMLIARSDGAGWENGPEATDIAGAQTAAARAEAAAALLGVSLESFGAIGNGVANDTAALQAAFTWSASTGRKLFGRPGAVYRITSVTATGTARIDWNGARVEITAAVTAFDLSARLYGPNALTANYVPGSLSLAVAALPAAPEPGRVMKIVSNGIDPSDRDNGSAAAQYPVAEFFTVGVGSTTTTIVLASPLRFTRAINPVSAPGDEAEVPAYTTALAARVIWADPTDRLEWIGGEIAYVAGLSGAAPAVRFYGFVDAVIRDAHLGPTLGQAMQLQGLVRPAILNPRFERLADNPGAGQLGYGVSDASYQPRVTGITGYGVRHLYTSSAPTMVAGASVKALIGCGRTVGAQIIGGHAANGVNPHYDTHHSSHDVLMSNLFSEGGGSFVASIRGRAITVANVIARGAALGVQAFTEYDSGDPDDDLFLAGKTRNDFTFARFTGLDLQCAASPVSCSYATMFVDGDVTVLTQDHRALECEGGRLVVTGRHVYTVSAGGGLASTGCVHVAAPVAAALGAFASASIEIAGDVTIDARLATATGISAFNIPAGQTVVVTGRLRIQLPAGATFLAGSGSIICQGAGLIEISVEGAADNALFPSAAVLAGLRVRALDGTVDWEDASLSAAQLRTVRTLAGLGVSHTGTGAEVQGVYTAPGQLSTKRLGDAGIGTIEVEYTGRKTGAVAAASLVIRSGGTNLVDTVQIPAAADQWRLLVRTHFTAPNVQMVTVQFQTLVTATGVTTTYTAVKNEAVAFASHGQVSSILGVNAAVGDSVQIDTAVTRATHGGFI